MKKYLLIFTAITLTLSCTKKEIGKDVSVTGFVKVINEAGSELFDRQDIKVTLKGGTATTYTDTNGKFLISGLNAGTSYGFDISKDGYGTVSTSNFSFIGDEKPGFIGSLTLYQTPTIELLNASLQYQNGVIFITGQITKTNQFRTISYANDSADVSDLHYDYGSYLSGASGSTYSSFQAGISLTNNTYKPGTTLYIAVYFSNLYDDGYYDRERGIYIRSSAKKAGVLKITL
jgi:hypothetical protein